MSTESPSSVGPFSTPLVRTHCETVVLRRVTTPQSRTTVPVYSLFNPTEGSSVDVSVGVTRVFEKTLRVV